MSIAGYYYLHTNGQLIFKPGTECAADIRESDFARMLWPCDPADRLGAWRILIESLSLGANEDRINELASKWACDDTDADEFASRAGIRLFMDGNAWCATATDFENLQESPAGFGMSKLQAMAELAKAMGFKAQKMWGTTFPEMLQGAAA
jgi:hypothetical protein